MMFNIGYITGSRGQLITNFFIINKLHVMIKGLEKMEEVFMEQGIKMKEKYII